VVPPVVGALTLAVTRPSHREGMPRSVSAGHIQGLDGLRALAATMVFVFHAWGQSGYPSITTNVFGLSIRIDPAITFGANGVALFFVLSGFLLSQPFWRKLIGWGPPVRVKDYLLRRLLRIYPAYLVAVLLFALVYDVAHPLFSRLIMVATHLLMVHNFSEVTVFNLSAPLWSVATEFQLYLLLPLIFWLLHILKDRGVRDLLNASGVFVAAGIMGAIMWPVLITLVDRIQPDPRFVVAGGHVLSSLPIFGLAHFATGIMAAFIYIKLQGRRSGQHIIHSPVVEVLAITSLLALALAALFSLELGVEPSGWPGLPLLFASLILWVSLGGARGGVTWFLELRPVRWIGLISYSFYLYHDFVLWNVYHRLPLGLLGPWADSSLTKGLVAYALTVGIAGASYALVERRLTKWLKDTLRGLRVHFESLKAAGNSA